MKKLLLIIIVLFFAEQSFSQYTGSKRLRKSKKADEWQVDKKLFMSGDTLFLTLHNNTYPKIGYYKDPEFYTLYKIINGKEVLMEDTTFRGIKDPIALLLNETVIINKVIIKPGNYIMKYSIFIYSEGNKDQKICIQMEQKFDVKFKARNKNLTRAMK